MDRNRVYPAQKQSRFSILESRKPSGGSPSRLRRKRSTSATDQHNKRLKSTLSQPEDTRDRLHIPTAETRPESLNVVSSNIASAVPYTIETRITLTLLGQAIDFDLNQMKADPRGLVELLKVTNSERGIWMTVGAYYRRIRNPVAAIFVMNELLQMMSANDIKGESVKSVYLLLAGCEADLARVTKLHRGDYSQHEQNAKNWLSKVYGSKATKESSLAADLEVLHQMSSSQPALDASQKAILNDKQISRIRVLEREVQCLRDRLAVQSKKMADIRSEKHNLEEYYDYERSLRRQLQKNVDEMKKQCELARKMEWLALDQLKTEVARRRKLEEQDKKQRKVESESSSEQ